MQPPGSRLARSAIACRRLGTAGDRMHGPFRIVAYAIASADGMIADETGSMPKSLNLEADQHFFEKALDHAAVVAHGRLSQEDQPNSPKRRRLVLTRKIAGAPPGQRERKVMEPRRRVTRGGVRVGRMLFGRGRGSRRPARLQSFSEDRLRRLLPQQRPQGEAAWWRAGLRGMPPGRTHRGGPASTGHRAGSNSMARRRGDARRVEAARP